MYLLDGTEAYRDAVRKVLGNLKGNYTGVRWGDKSADGYRRLDRGRDQPVQPRAGRVGRRLDRQPDPR